MKNSILKNYVNEITRRGGETGIYYGYRASALREKPLEHLASGKSEGKTVHLVGCDAWRYYSRRFGSRPASLRYLVGKDDSGLWAVRVPGKVDTVADAVAYITPAIVLKARKARRRVLRQGNLYLVEAPRARAHLDNSPIASFGSHEYHRRARVLLHPEHAPLQVPAGVCWVPVEQKTLNTARGGVND